MGIFSGNSTPFDPDVEKITDEKNTSEDWGMIIDLCDRVKATNNGPRDCLKSVVKRLHHPVPHVVLQAVTLLDACINNCGKQFKLEVASRDFENDFKKALAKSHPKVQRKLRSLLKKWAEVDFKGDPQLNLVPGLYQALCKEGQDFGGGGGGSDAEHQPKSSSSSVRNPNVASSQQEEEDIAKAIQLSLKQQPNSNNASASSSSSSPNLTTTAARSGLYPTVRGGVAAATAAASPTTAKHQKKVRALYDFEAAEENELTFKAGEIVIISDDSDSNWWKGSNHRGEGLFPANFVTNDLDAEPDQFAEERRRRKGRRSVQFNEEVEVKSVPPTDEGAAAAAAAAAEEISEERIDAVMAMLNEADPAASPQSDPSDLAAEERRVNAAGPLIDAELERIDRRHAQLTRISTELVDALNLYHQLMHEMPPAGDYVMGGGGGAAATLSPPMTTMPPYRSYDNNNGLPAYAAAVAGGIPYGAPPPPPEMMMNGMLPYSAYAPSPPQQQTMGNAMPPPPLADASSSMVVADRPFHPPASSAPDVGRAQQRFVSATVAPRLPNDESFGPAAVAPAMLSYPQSPPPT